MRKYQNLCDYLSAAGSDCRRMRFDEIEQLLGFVLPDSARRHPAWWANDPDPNRHSSAWLSAGWVTVQAGAIFLYKAC